MHCPVGKKNRRKIYEPEKSSCREISEPRICFLFCFVIFVIIVITITIPIIIYTYRHRYRYFCKRIAQSVRRTIEESTSQRNGLIVK